MPSPSMQVMNSEKSRAPQLVLSVSASSMMAVAMACACSGVMACSTCHVLVAKDWFAQLPEASEDEEDMLDLAYGVRPTSRLSCQITLTDALDGMEVTTPADAHDMSGR